MTASDAKRLNSLQDENRRLKELLEREGWLANHELKARLYQEERLARRRRERQKRGCVMLQ